MIATEAVTRLLGNLAQDITVEDIGDAIQEGPGEDDKYPLEPVLWLDPQDLATLLRVISGEAIGNANVPLVKWPNITPNTRSGIAYHTTPPSPWVVRPLDDEGQD